VGNSQDVINAVADLRVDIGLIEGRVMPPILLPSRGWKMSWWCLPRRIRRCWKEVTLQRLAEAPWILREHGSGTREIVDYLLLSHLPAFHLGMELGNSEAIKHAVRHGLGISCLSRRLLPNSWRWDRWLS
jgi:DNA-binding transcriptional LysR family regulator